MIRFIENGIEDVKSYMKSYRVSIVSKRNEGVVIDVYYDAFTEKGAIRKARKDFSSNIIILRAVKAED